MTHYRLSEIAEIIGAQLWGEDGEVRGINALPLAKEDELSFVDSLKRLPQAQTTKAKALIAPMGFRQHLSGKTLLETRDVRVALAKVTRLFAREYLTFQGISPQAYVDPSAKIEEDVTIFPFVYVGKDVFLGRGVIIYPFCFIGDYCEIGEGTILYPHVVLYPRTIVGKRCILHGGVVLGADGFGFAQEAKSEGYKNLKIYHFGLTRIEDEVEIGANSTIDRATFGETLIGAGTKIDNLVQVGHNVNIGKECLLVSHTAIGGSVTLEDYVMLGGQVGVAPGSVLRRGCRVAAKSGVVGEVPEGAEVAGIPAISASVWRRAVKIFEKLPEILKDIRQIKDLYSKIADKL
ncbi:MAG: UDP-3-O-(3-hydroxymyristoyl)glucosamine N-acyltransferase [Caldimicrobium sp.]|nr:UDP-3-O-(3-hydroxymyristoyl)glucosamine N-acyltransferase [Caldimicrobium sp.]MCX7874495.1 UDP-3-O-(3-hydroxymyristoyl)glucosamine N-acyltransferase [Caldimicrobium sp.]MDW8094548.1 UDP-3-O-(3-hydroxymyristoyl)glucosamine N-acyltransferase [Caldimicrobium sp.]